MNAENTTIAAISTKKGGAGISVIRVSGKDALKIAEKMFYPLGGKKLVHSKLMLGEVKDKYNKTIDNCFAVYFKAPKSYTKEDVIEFQTHGGDIVTEEVLKRVTELGAKHAEPGEFTYRAFINGRIDLTQAEAIMSVISASSPSLNRASQRQLSGGINSFIKEERTKLLNALSLIEAAIDYPEEIDEEVEAQRVISLITEVKSSLSARIDERKSRLIKNGIKICLAGKPNVGKSSLMNLLTLEETSIVTDIPGTTRDVIKHDFVLNGIKMTVSDTAGQRTEGDRVELIGIDRARREMDLSDCVILILDGSKPLDDNDYKLLGMRDERFITVINKCDLNNCVEIDGIKISAKTKEGTDVLLNELGKRFEFADTDYDIIMAERQLGLVKEAVLSLNNALNALNIGEPIDIASVDIHNALESMYKITGENATEEVISAVFKNFCVGK